MSQSTSVTDEYVLLIFTFAFRAAGSFILLGMNSKCRSKNAWGPLQFHNYVHEDIWLELKVIHVRLSYTS